MADDLPAPHHLRYDVAGAAHDHRIADAQPQTLNFIGVVQGGVADGHPGHQHRLKARHRRNRAGAANLKLHFAHHGDLLLRREFERRRPARRTRHKAQRFLQIDIVNLDHHAVDVETELRAVLLDTAIKRQHFLAAGAALGAIADRQAPALNCIRRSKWLRGSSPPSSRPTP